MHVVTHLSDEYEEADAGERLVHRRGRHGAARRHRRHGDDELATTGDRRRHDPRLHDRQRRRGLHLARRRHDAVRGRARAPCSRAACASPDRSLAGQGAGEQGRERHDVRARLVPDASPRPPATRHRRAAARGKQIGEKHYKVHLDGYDQLDLLTGKGPSKRDEVCYFAEETARRRAHRRLEVPLHRSAEGWLGGTVKVDWPIITNLRLDPFERTSYKGPARAVRFLRARVLALRLRAGGGAKLGQSFIDFPPMQKRASFNLEAVKQQVARAIRRSRETDVYVMSLAIVVLRLYAEEEARAPSLVAHAQPARLVAAQAAGDLLGRHELRARDGHRRLKSTRAPRGRAPHAASRSPRRGSRPPWGRRRGRRHGPSRSAPTRPPSPCSG